MGDVLAKSGTGRTKGASDQLSLGSNGLKAVYSVPNWLKLLYASFVLTLVTAMRRIQIQGSRALKYTASGYVALR